VTHTKRTALFWISSFALLAGREASGQTTTAVRATLPSPPTVTVLTAASGAIIQSLGPGDSSLNLGTVSYFKGTSAPGESSQKKSGALVVTTMFSLKIDCPGSSASSQVSVSVSRLDAAASHAIAIDGTPLGTTSQILTSSMACGSSAEHRLDLEVPVTTPAGSIGSNITFVATLKN
jgi:hypothetical protein